MHPYTQKAYESLFEDRFKLETALVSQKSRSYFLGYVISVFKCEPFRLHVTVNNQSKSATVYCLSGTYSNLPTAFLFEKIRDVIERICHRHCQCHLICRSSQVLQRLFPWRHAVVVLLTFAYWKSTFPQYVDALGPVRIQKHIADQHGRHELERYYLGIAKTLCRLRDGHVQVLVRRLSRTFSETLCHRSRERLAGCEQAPTK